MHTDCRHTTSAEPASGPAQHAQPPRGARAEAASVIRRRIAEGFYDSPAVAEALARRIVAIVAAT